MGRAVASISMRKPSSLGQARTGALALVSAAVLASFGTAAVTHRASTHRAGTHNAGTHQAGTGRGHSTVAWGKALVVPGTAALNKGGQAEVNSLSCASAGNCSAGGDYLDGRGNSQAFVVDEVKGTWQKAEEVPGTAALNKAGDALVDSVSCASAGNCSAGGYYSLGLNNQQAFVVNELKGTWQKAEEVPGTAALNQADIIGPGGDAQVSWVSCASAGACSAGGYYTDHRHHQQAFVVNEVKGTWQKAEQVPGTATTSPFGSAEVNSVSCVSPGNCTAGGDYSGAALASQAFVVNEVNGTWQKAEEVPGTAALNKGGNAEVLALSCVSPGNCSAGGVYSASQGLDHDQAFVVNEVNGTWQKAEEVPGTAALNKGGVAEVGTLSCASAGNCSAGGHYSDGHHRQVFVVNEKKGIWQKAEELPGIAALNRGGFAEIFQISCVPAGNCAAGGFYADRSGSDRAFVANEERGTWRKIETLPGTGSGAAVYSLSCPSVGHCSAGGGYNGHPEKDQAFVVNETS